MIIVMHAHYLTEEEDFEKNFIQELDKVGVDKAVVLGNDIQNLMDDKGNFRREFRFREVNEYVSSFIKNYPDRIIGVPYLDPRESNASSSLEKWTLKHHCSGAKIMPSMGFYPNDRKIYSFYEKALELRVPVMIHSGGTGRKDVRQKFTAPLYIDDVAVDFPDLNIIVVHSGKPLIEQTMCLSRRPNVFVETSSLGSPVVFNKELQYILIKERVQRLLTVFGPERVLFGGSDHNYKDIGEFLNQLNQILDELGIMEKDKEMIFGKGAERIF